MESEIFQNCRKMESWRDENYDMLLKWYCHALGLDSR